MKKLMFATVGLCFLLGLGCLIYYGYYGYKIKTENVTSYNIDEYPNKRWEKGYSHAYSDDIQAKYPDIINIQKLEQNKLTENLKKGIINPEEQEHVYEIKRDKNGLLGVYETDTKKRIIPHKYRYIEQCSAMNYFMFFNARNYDEKKILDYKNNVLFESNYDELDCTSCWCGIKTKHNNKYGMVSYSGIEVLKPEFDEIECQQHRGTSGGYYYIAKKGTLYGIWDNLGKEIIPLQTKKLSKSSKGHHFFEYEDNGKTGIMDIYGKLLTEAQYNDIMHKQFSQQVTSDKNKTTNNLISDIVKNNVYQKYGKENVHQLSMDYYAISQPPMDMFIVNKYGQKTSNKTYWQIHRLSENYAQFINSDENGRTFGVIDFKGNIIMQSRDREIQFVIDATKNGLILVSTGEKYGIFNKQDLLIKPEYEKIYFNRGHVLIRFYKDDKRYYYIASFEDFANNNGDLSKCAQYRTNTYKKLDENCFRVNDENGEEKVYCAK